MNSFSIQVKLFSSVTIPCLSTVASFKRTKEDDETQKRLIFIISKATLMWIHFMVLHPRHLHCKVESRNCSGIFTPQWTTWFEHDKQGWCGMARSMIEGGGIGVYADVEELLLGFIVYLTKNKCRGMLRIRTFIILWLWVGNLLWLLGAIKHTLRCGNVWKRFVKQHFAVHSCIDIISCDGMCFLPSRSTLLLLMTWCYCQSCGLCK